MYLITYEMSCSVWQRCIELEILDLAILYATEKNVLKISEVAYV